MDQNSDPLENPQRLSFCVPVTEAHAARIGNKNST
jgi:hypothetical protein